MLITTLALLAAFSLPVAGQASLPGQGPVLLVQADSAHTLFTPNAPDPGRSGQVYQLPQGGLGVTTGGTAHYQTLGTPNGSAVAVPGGNNASSIIGSGGHSGTAPLPAER